MHTLEVNFWTMKLCEVYLIHNPVVVAYFKALQGCMSQFDRHFASEQLLTNCKFQNWKFSNPFPKS